MVTQRVFISNATGLHLRPAGLLCETAMKFASKITFKTDDNYEANAKSVLSVLGACVKSGQEIQVFCEGEDEEEALDEIIRAIEGGLGE